MTSRGLLLACAAAIAATAAGFAASASTTLGVDFNYADVGFTGFDIDQFTLGYAFEDRKPTSVVGLGSLESRVFAGDMAVGLWDSAGALLASTTVSLPGSPVGSAPWVFSPITPVALTPGQTYYVGYFGESYYATEVNPISVDPHIKFLHDAWAYGGLAFPSNVAGKFVEHAYFGGNVELSSAATPEPSTWAMMLTGLAALGAALRRRVTA
jgi:hypothetical protein